MTETLIIEPASSHVRTQLDPHIQDVRRSRP